MTADAMIDYDSLQQEALRGMVRAVLHNVAKSGLPGDHHLYISFDVRAPGVVLSKRLREKYPHEMTIVLQHRFWDLAVGDERFEVKLTFDGIPAPILSVQDSLLRVVAPYALTDRQRAQVRVTYQGRLSDIFTVPAAPLAPAMFTLDESGKGPALARTEEQSELTTHN